MHDSPSTLDQLEDMQRRLAFVEACADPFDFDGMVARTSALLFKWAQAEFVGLILPPGAEEESPSVYVCGRQPLLGNAERSLRDASAELLADLKLGRVSGDALGLARGPELTPLHEAVRDDALFCFWSSPLEAGGETVGVVALFGFTDWILAPRLRRLLAGLTPPLSRGVWQASMVARLHASAVEDDLTGLLNRRGTWQALDRERARADRTKRPLAALVVDVDRFKEVNDTHGHLAGDAVLRGIGDRLRDCLRTTDVVGRLGGDEFLVLLPDTDEKRAAMIRDRLIQSIGELAVPGGGFVSISVGAAEYVPGCGESNEELVQRADDALYGSKRRGRGRLTLAG